MENQEDLLSAGIKQRWRKIADEAVLAPGDYACILATRSEMQVAGDWMLLPAARNLHWRYAVLRSAFPVCQQKVSPGESMSLGDIDPGDKQDLATLLIKHCGDRHQKEKSQW